MMKTSDIERLFRDNYSELFRVANFILHDPEEAHDVVHDIFAALMESDYGDNITSHFLLRSLKNRCLNRLRDLSVAERVKGLYLTESPEEDPESVNTDAARLEQINAIVSNELSDAGRRVMELRYSEGLSYKEIASALQISESCVYKHLRHSLDIIRLKLCKNG